MTPDVTVRGATAADVATLLEMIEALADFEHLRADCVVTAESLAEHLFGPRPLAEALVAEVDGGAAGFALFFGTYSTFLGRPGLWLEDLFVLPGHRRGGVGAALLHRVAQLAVERGCGRLEWAVLGWNRPALDMYARAGAELLDDWTTCRLDGAALARLATG
jgi:GNAT superfamily N-acetyltransferase